MKVKFFRDIILENDVLNKLAFTYYELCQELKIRSMKGIYDYMCHRGEAHNLLMKRMAEKVNVDFDKDREDIHEAVMKIFGEKN